MTAFAGWQLAVLARIKAPPTANNIQLLSAWQQAEGGTAKNNPLNTTLHQPGAQVYNTFTDANGHTYHVWSYQSSTIGAKATADTLTNGYYPGILAALRKGDVAPSDVVRQNTREFQSWGTNPVHIAQVLG